MTRFDALLLIFLALVLVGMFVNAYSLRLLNRAADADRATLGVRIARLEKRVSVLEIDRAVRLFEESRGSDPHTPNALLAGPAEQTEPVQSHTTGWSQPPDPEEPPSYLLAQDFQEQSVDPMLFHQLHADFPWNQPQSRNTEAEVGSSADESLREAP